MAEVNGSLLVKGDVQAEGTFKDFKLEVLATDPIIGDLTEPRLWVNSGGAKNVIKFFNGTEVTELGEVGEGVTQSELEAALNAYVTTTALGTALGDYLKKTDIATELSEYALKTDLDAKASAQSVTDLGTKLNGSFFSFSSAAAATSHAVAHNLGFRYPIVQVVDAVTGKQITPDSITFTDTNNLTVALGVAADVEISVGWAKAGA